MSKCAICQKEGVSLRMVNLYVRGSEGTGLGLCSNCEMMVAAYIDSQMGLCADAFKEGFRAGNRERQPVIGCGVVDKVLDTSAMLQELKENFLREVAFHKQHCNFGDCGISLCLLVNLADRAGIQFTNEERSLLR